MNDQDVIYNGILPFSEIVVYPSQEEQRKLAVKRAEKAELPHFDFSKALDISKERAEDYTSREWCKHPLFRPWLPKNCINTATYWITGNNTISANKHLLDNPEKYGYKRISKHEAEPGDLTQYYFPDTNHAYHAGVVLENNDDGTVIKSSSGSDKLNPIRYYDTEGVDMEDPYYNDDIKNNLYYRYTYPYSGVYFNYNGKLKQAKKQGGIIGLYNVIGIGGRL